MYGYNYIYISSPLSWFFFLFCIQARHTASTNITLAITICRYFLSFCIFASPTFSIISLSFIILTSSMTNSKVRKYRKILSKFIYTVRTSARDLTYEKFKTTFSAIFDFVINFFSKRLALIT